MKKEEKLAKSNREGKKGMGRWADKEREGTWGQGWAVCKASPLAFLK